MIYHNKIGKIELLIEINRLEKEKRRNRLEEKLREQEFYGEIEELFDPLTITLKVYNEKNFPELKKHSTC